MKIVVFFLEFAAAWFVGNIISASITQIGCCLFCSFPILRRLEPYADSINVSKAQAFYWRTVLIHAAFLAVTSWVVIAYMPDAVIWGFFLSFAFTVLIGAGRWGRNSVNVEEFLKIIEKFVAPGKDDAAFYALSGVLTNWDNWEKPKKESSSKGGNHCRYVGNFPVHSCIREHCLPAWGLDAVCAHVPAAFQLGRGAGYLKGEISYVHPDKSLRNGCTGRHGSR